jgi:hypothetical protein
MSSTWHFRLLVSRTPWYTLAPVDFEKPPIISGISLGKTSGFRAIELSELMRKG